MGEGRDALDAVAASGCQHPSVKTKTRKDGFLPSSAPSPLLLVALPFSSLSPHFYSLYLFVLRSKHASVTATVMKQC